MKTTQTILIVDDTESNIDILINILGDYDILVATNGRDALEIANEEDVDLILLDIVMPEINGFEVCKQLKKDPKTKQIPVVFMTAYTDEDAIEKAYDVGGVDYVSKPFMPKEVKARVKTQIKMITLIKNLEFMSFYDSMTGVYNRRKFFELGEIKFASTEGILFALMIDLDNFKSINDTYGHHIGDKVIKLLANEIRKFILEDSVFGRLGGEEFAILCTCESSEKLMSKIETLRRNVEELEVSSDDKKIKFTISSGVAKRTDEMKTVDELLREADEALYIAKGSGRNRAILRR